MAEITVCKAQPAGPAYPTPEAHIHISAELPEFPFNASKDDLNVHLRESADRYDEQARLIEEALHGALPGGTYDRLTARMLLRKASHFRIAYGTEG